MPSYRDLWRRIERVEAARAPGVPLVVREAHPPADCACAEGKPGPCAACRAAEDDLYAAALAEAQAGNPAIREIFLVHVVTYADPKARAGATHPRSTNTRRKP